MRQTRDGKPIFKFYRKGFSAIEKEEMRKWADENIGPLHTNSWSYSHGGFEPPHNIYFEFYSRNDLIDFKMRWG